MSLFRTLFNVLNAVLLTFGLAVLFLGFHTTMKDEVPLAGVADDNLRMSSLTIGVVGIVIIGTSVFGFVGVNRSLKFFTGIYIICLGVSALAFIALGVYIITNVVALKSKIKQNAIEKFKSYFDKKEVRDELDQIQFKYECCGIEGTSSNLEIFDLNKPGWVPSFCCEEEIVEIRNCTRLDAFKVGCDVQLEQELDSLCYPLAGLSFGCAVYCIVISGLAGYVKKDE